MNPYLSVGIAMCGIVILALFGTSYMAVYFNRRAKADLAAALDPLRAVVQGEADLEEAKVTGRFAGHIAEGRVAQLPGGMGRVFLTSVIDGAGGSKWSWTVSRSKESGGPDTHQFEGQAAGLEDQLRPAIVNLAADRTLVPMWMRVDYDPSKGYVRLTKPMRVRRDIPVAAAFETYLKGVMTVAAANRAAQYGDG